MPTTRGDVTLSASVPTVEEHEEPAGGGGAVVPVVEGATLTVTLSTAVPPGPVQVIPKVVSFVRPPDAFLPLVATTLPCHRPVSVHDVALVDDQLTHTPSPDEMLFSVTLMVAVGAAAAEALFAEPRAPRALTATNDPTSSDQGRRSLTEVLCTRAPCEECLPE
jgi:hypothetical protein